MTLTCHDFTYGETDTIPFLSYENKKKITMAFNSTEKWTVAYLMES